MYSPTGTAADVGKMCQLSVSKLRASKSTLGAQFAVAPLLTSLHFAHSIGPHQFEAVVTDVRIVALVEDPALFLHSRGSIRAFVSKH